jgi:hypothetical protein
MSAAFPSLKKMQREDGPQGRARFQYYQKLAAFVFAIAQVRGGLFFLGGGGGCGGLGGVPCSAVTTGVRVRPLCPDAHALPACTRTHARAPTITQAVGQLSYIRPYVTDFSPEWLFSSSLALVAGALSLIYVAGVTDALCDALCDA